MHGQRFKPCAFHGSHADHNAYGTVTWNLRAGRTYFAPGDVLDGTSAATNQLGTERTVRMMAPVPSGARGAAPGTMREETRSFGISEPDEDGDGTVPHRSGVAAKPYCKAFLRANVGHEPVYNPEKEGEQALRNLRFTLRVIVQIAQDIQHVSRMNTTLDRHGCENRKRRRRKHVVPLQIGMILIK